MPKICCKIQLSETLRHLTKEMSMQANDYVQMHRVLFLKNTNSCLAGKS